MFNWFAVRSGQWRPSRRVVEIILKHDLLGLSVEVLPDATPHPLIGRRWEDIEAQIGLPRIAGTGAVVEYKAVAVRGKHEGDVERGGVVERLLDPVRCSAIPTQALPQPSRTIVLQGGRS